ncbi:MAG: DNA internalization-related competence protein ComEC/Rec2 [Oscillospiraceae bacterium]|nr:DNA internalization-related competence protein ComEC/Rec2 [Oscillospiraceae bacterium]
MRYLLYIAIGYVSALVLCSYILPESSFLYFAVAFLVLALIGLIFKKKLRKAILLVCISAAIGFGWNSVYSLVYISPAEKLIGSNATVYAQVLDMPKIGDGYSSVTVKLMQESYPACKVLVTSYDGGFDKLRPGDIAEFDLRFRTARTRYNVEDDYYFASGIFLRAYLDGEYNLVEHESGLRFLPQAISHKLKEQILRVFPDDVAHLMKALLTGDKGELYEDDKLYVSLRLSGLSHIVAVSGMHVAFIISLIAIFTGRRRITAFIGIPAVWFFAAMIGFTPSVTRASIMISLMLIAPILRRENDPPTAIASALLVILLVNPKAVASISLQLSFGAMCGISLISPSVFNFFVEFTSKLSGILRRMVLAISALISASIGAMVCTVPLAALHFSSVPVYSIVSNILCLWAMSAAFTLGYVAVIISAIYFPLGHILACLVAWLPRYTIFVVKLISKIPGNTLYTGNFLGAIWVVYVYLVFAVPYLAKKKASFRPIIPLCCCIVSYAIVYMLTFFVVGREESVTAVDVGQGQCIIAATEQATAVIDCGGKNSSVNPGDAAAEYLLSHGRDTIDALVLTHLHDDHANGVIRLMSYVDVKRVILAGECEKTEIGDRILEICYDNGTEVIMIEDNTSVNMDGLSLELIAPIGSEDINESGLIVYGDYGDFEFLVTGDAGKGTENQLVSFYSLGEIDLLVAGHHGSKTSTGEILLEETKPETAFISVGNNSYGHPSEEVLARLREYDVDVYRTDLHGNITITVGND